MKRLWAPWRIKYVSEVNKQKKCIFCEKSKGRKDRENLVVLRGKHCFALLNIYPYNNGHIMVAPYQHLPDLGNLDEDVILEMFDMLKELEVRLRKKLRPDGFNIGINIGKAAGAGFEEHLHIHLVPRWAGDTNFMPVISGTKVISQSLQSLYQILKKDE